MHHVYPFIRKALLPALLTVSYTVSAQTPCTPVYTDGCDFFGDKYDIDNLTVSGANGSSINQTGTGCSAGAYADYTTTVPPVAFSKNSNYTINIATDPVNGFAGAEATVWIDFNNNGTFESGEMVGATSGGSFLLTFSVPVTIPASAPPGDHRMRVRTAWNQTPADPCVAYQSGETHDYTINIPSSLPVEWSEITVKNKGSYNCITWETQQEIYNLGFAIEKSVDGKNFRQAGWMPTKAEEGNSNTPLYYQWDDTSPLSGKNYYRLLQKDQDGYMRYSGIFFTENNTGDISILPNPVISTLELRCNSNQKIKSVSLTNMHGLILLRDNEGQKRSFNMSNLNAGLYLLHIQKDDGSIQTHKIIKTK